MKICKAILSMALAVAPVILAGTASAQQDSSSNLVNGFSQVSQGKGLMVRVPVNAQGQEDGRLAEVRVPFSASVNSNDVNQLARAFDASTKISPSMFDVTNDSSTHLNFGGYGYGWNYGYYYGWQNPNYFYSYNWGYAYNNYTYVYATPYYSTYYAPYYYNNYNYYGYRYYYYPRGW